MTTEEPLPDELLDELLSADLDGELEAAAADHGIAADEARRLIDQSPGAAARLVSFEQAREAIAVEGLDEMTRRRLIAAAAAELTASASPAPVSRRRVDWQRLGWPRLAAVAAAVVLVVGVVSVVVARDEGSDDATELAADLAVPPEDDALNGLVVEEFDGDVAQAPVLRTLLESSAGSRVEAAGGDAALEVAPDVDEAAGETADDATLDAGGAESEPPAAATGDASAQEDTASDDGAARAPSPSPSGTACLSEFRDAYDAEPQQLFTARHGERPALVVIFDLDGLTAAVVLDAATCAPLEFQSLG